MPLKWTMKKTGLFVLTILILASCKDKKNVPDISKIEVKTVVQRFDQDFFALDTIQLQSSLSTIAQKYPSFLPLYLENILGISDPAEIKGFYQFYKPIFDSSQRVYKNFKPVQEDLEKAFRYLKYYFPSYNTPATIIPVIGRMDSRNDLARMENGEYTPIFIGPGMIGISLQFYLGSKFSLYSNEYFVNNVAPLYRSRRFSKEYIVSDIMKLVSDDMFPDGSAGKALIDQMIEKGKQWWLLDKLLPGLPDSVKTGYTQAQLDWCRQNEGLAWSYILKNESLQSVDPATIQTYIGESPFTSTLSQEESPGNIGTWFGWQIVKKYEEEFPDLKPEQIMHANPKQILEGAKYKPK